MTQQDEFFKQVGRITVNFSLLEFNLGLVIGTLISGNFDIGLMVTTEQSFRQKLSLLSSLAKHARKLSAGVNPTPAGALEAMIRTMTRLEAQRNAVTHSIWSAAEKKDDGRRYRVKITAKASKGLHHGFEEFTIADLAKLGDDLGNTSKTLLQLFVSTIPNKNQQGARST